MMPVPSLCRICLTINEECEIVWHIGSIPPTQFIKEIFQIEVEPKMCAMCKRCERELNHFYVFYKMVKDAQQTYLQTLDGMNLKQEKMFIKQEAYYQTDIASKQHIKEEKLDSEIEVGFDDMDADKCQSKDHEEKIDVGNQVSAVCNSTVDRNIDTSMRVVDVKKEGKDAQSRIKQASKTFLSKYSLNQVYENDKWLINEEDKKEIVSWFVNLKCNFTVCSALANFENLPELEQHALSIHESYPKLFCCDKFYSTYSIIETHVLKKHVLKNKKIINVYVPCDVCGKSVRKFNMKYHLYSHLPNDKRNIQCDQCDARFITKSKLKNHLESFHSTQSVSCDICGKTFKNKHAMDSHKARHKSVKYLCPECGKSIKDIVSYNMHLQAHYGQIPKVKCEICGKVVKQISLRIHLRSHNPEALKQCPHCPYKSSQSLRAHIKGVHEKVKPYACSMCPMKFLTQKAQGDHVSSRHTGIPRYSCPFCDKTFMSSGNFFVHRKRMHPNEMAEKKLQMSGNLDNLPVGKLTKKTPILEGEASVLLERKLSSAKKQENM